MVRPSQDGLCISHLASGLQGLRVQNEVSWRVSPFWTHWHLLRHLVPRKPHPCIKLPCLIKDFSSPKPNLTHSCLSLPNGLTNFNT